MSIRDASRGRLHRPSDEISRAKLDDILNYGNLDPGQRAIMAPIIQAQIAAQRRQEIRETFRTTYHDDCERFVMECIAWERFPGANGPTPYQRRGLRSLIEDKRVAFVGPHGLGKCTKNGQLLQLYDGSVVPVETLVGKSFEVLAIDTSDMSIHRAVGMAEDNGPRTTIRITTDKGRVIERTEEHPLWGDLSPYRWDRSCSSKRLRPVGSWVAASDLTPGSTIAVSLGHRGERSCSLSDDAIKVAAYLLADGGLTSPTSIGYTKSDPALVDDLRRSVEAFGCTLNKHAADFQYGIACGNGRPNPILELLREWGMMGRSAHQKSFPAWVWHLNDRQLALFLSRLYAGDGWVHAKTRRDGRTNKEIGYCTVSEMMAHQLSMALLRLGIHAEVRTKKTSWSHLGKRNTSTAWCVNIHDVENILAFCERVGVFTKEEAIATIASICRAASPKEQQRWRHHGLPNHLVWERIVKVERFENQPTTAITVPGFHTYLTEFVEHNTAFNSWVWHWFVATRDGFDEWKSLTTAGSWKQLIAFLWPEIRMWTRYIRWEKLGRAPYSRTEELLQLSFKGATGISEAVAPTDPTVIEGAHAPEILFQYDESKAIAEQLFDATEGAFSQAGPTTGRNAFLVATSTPGEPRGRFYNIIKDRVKYSDWNPIQVTFEETVEAGLNDESWREKRKIQWGEKSPIYINRVLGQFVEEIADGVLPMGWVARARERWMPEGLLMGDGTLDPRRQRRAYGIDPADAGDDMAATCEIWTTERGNIWVAPLDYNQSDDPIVTSDRIVELTSGASQIPIGVDVIGVGAAIPPYLRKMRRNPVPFISTATATSRDRTGNLEFGNTRAWGWWKLREYLSPSSDILIALPDDDRLEGDLVAPTYSERGGRIYIESKEELRKADRLGHSTDGADAVIIALACDALGSIGFLDGAKPKARKRTTDRVTRWSRLDRSRLDITRPRDWR